PRILRLAGLESGGTPSAGQPHAAGVEPEGARQFVFRDALEVATYDLEVDRVETGRLDFDQDLVGARDGIGEFGEPDTVGDRTIAVENKGSHGSSCGLVNSSNGRWWTCRVNGKRPAANAAALQGAGPLASRASDRAEARPPLNDPELTPLSTAQIKKIHDVTNSYD